jgi:hypothetical protein
MAAGARSALAAGIAGTWRLVGIFHLPVLHPQSSISIHRGTVVDTCLGSAPDICHTCIALHQVKHAGQHHHQWDHAYYDAHAMEGKPRATLEDLGVGSGVCKSVKVLKSGGEGGEWVESDRVARSRGSGLEGC